jgi:hypothetical protein
MHKEQLLVKNYSDLAQNNLGKNQHATNSNQNKIEQ